MSTIKQGRYSVYLRPISYLIDLSIVNGLALSYFFKGVEPLNFVLIISTSWIILSIFSKFYSVYRYTREVSIVALLFRQLALFTMMIFAFSGCYNELNILPKVIFKYVGSVLFLVALFKFALYYLLQKYRVSFGGNYSITVILGKN